ncbi:glycoside hydrolase family 17-like protein [Phytophthora cinnamomi]|uniref:glycoside hydrolase family 17-like protein n=1 Tax=Phytophthora cinnamomi TaxID=4785 RepID=UPI00355AA19B|nr:glycoside hydrolase family 17-like protein [Phytophthora cinnamomi]
MHSTAYPLTDSDTLDTTALEERLLMLIWSSSHIFTHGRTSSQFYGVGVAQYAAAHGIKLHLATTPGSVKAILIGNENLYTGTTASEIVAIATSIKETSVTMPTASCSAQCSCPTEYLDTDYDDQINQLSESPTSSESTSTRSSTTVTTRATRC